MTRYEFFEAWLTAEEWATWKKHCLKRIQVMQGVSRDTAKVIRQRFLHNQVSFNPNNAYEVSDLWDELSNRYIRWADTPQGHNHWSNVNNRREPIRLLPQQRTISNTAN